MAVKVSVAGSGTTTASLSTVNPNVKISTIGIQGPAGTGIDLTTAGTLTASKAIVVDTDSKIDVLKSGDLVITGSANTIGHADDTDLLTIASGTFTVAGTTITTGLTIGGTGVTSTATELNILDGVTSTATELNILDGDTSATSTTLAAADRIVVNDAGTMKQVALSDLETFMEDALDTGTNLTTVGALDSGSITSGFGTIDTGSSTITTTGLISGGSLDIDNVLINGTTIGHTDDTDLMTVASGVLTVAGEVDATSLDISGNADIDGTLEADAYTVDGTALNEYIADTVGAMVGSNTETNITVTYEDGDNTLDFVIGTLNQDTSGTADNITISANNSTDETVYPIFVDGATGSQGAESDTGLTYNPSTGLLTSTGFSGNLTGTLQTAAQTNVTSLGTLTALTVDDVAINGKVVTMTGSTSDTATITVGTNGTLDIVTTDDAAAAADIQITADGTAELAGTTVTLDSSGGITLDADGGTITFADGGSGLGTITSSGYSGTAAVATTVTVTDSTSNTNFPVVFHDESNALLDDTGALRYNPSTGQLLVPNLTVAGTTTQVDTVTMQAANAVIFEGATADEYETILTIVDPTADHTQYLINQSGYIPVLAASTTTTITSTPAELNILDGVTSTATELNIVDGDTSAGTTAVAGGDGIVTNDGSTMRQTTVDTFDTYLSATTKTLTNKTLTTPTIAEIDSGSTITLDATTDIVLDADGGDVFFKDAGTTFGSATNTSGNLIIKSGTTTAATFSGANVTFAGTLAATSIDGGSFS